MIRFIISTRNIIVYRLISSFPPSLYGAIYIYISSFCLNHLYHRTVQGNLVGFNLNYICNFCINHLHSRTF